LWWRRPFQDGLGRGVMSGQGGWSSRFGSGWGRVAGRRQHACKPAAAAAAVQPGEEDDREGRASWAGQGPVEVHRRRPKRREGRVGRPGWMERQAEAGPNPEPGQNSKEILFEFQLILEFGGTFKICTRIFRNKFGMRIFPKVF
jgi:hypothetical protein